MRKSVVRNASKVGERKNKMDCKISTFCKCCEGTGVQKNKEEINIKCPECNGTGQVPGYTISGNASTFKDKIKTK